MTQDNQNGNLQNAGEIIQRFGGIRPMATKMDVPVTTVQGWKKRNVIPENRRHDVLQAARLNHIDLSDLIDDAANENVTGFAQTMEAVAPQQTSGEARARHEEAVKAGLRTFQEEKLAASRTGNQEELVRNIKRAEQRAVQKSTLITVGLVALVAGLGGFLLWPTQQTVLDHGQRLRVIEKDVEDVKAQQALFKGLNAAGLEEKFTELKDQAGSLQEQLADAMQRAENLAATVTDPNAGSLTDRLGRLESQIAGMVGTPALANLMSKLRALQQSAEGQALLSQSVSDLSGLMAGLQSPDQLDGALVDAQQQQDALGETLQGVSQTDLKAAALLLTLTQLRTSLNRQVPFSEDLALLQKMLGNDDPELSMAIERLAPQAARGVLSPAGLSAELRGLAGEIVVASLTGQDVTMKDKALARLNDVMQVKKDGEMISGTDTQATIARAQLLLDSGDVQGAITELQALEGPAAQTAAPLIDQAQATVLAQKVQGMLTNQVFSRISGRSVPYTAGGDSFDDLLNMIEGLGRTGGASSVYTGPDTTPSIVP